jgi:hypothetical protein
VKALLQQTGYCQPSVLTGMFTLLVNSDFSNEEKEKIKEMIDLIFLLWSRDRL